ncbi:hypoxanthine-guanine phosphoribosyltransferase [Neisseriaceae bacterium CLB008]|nr:hypoxanthine-guanine phosphoribosyltransferase [Neisseriaceae bacterium]
MHSLAQTQAILDEAELLFDEPTCEAALAKMAQDITATLGDKYPLVLPVMGGAVVFTGQLLPKLTFPLDFDYVHVSRYGDKLSGGNFNWTRFPKEGFEGRHVLILDDILDEGHTMVAIKEKVLSMGALSCHCAVFANKLLPQTKPMQADFVGLDVPNRYVFGYGMDVSGSWRNLPAIYALKEPQA